MKFLLLIFGQLTVEWKEEISRVVFGESYSLMCESDYKESCSDSNLKTWRMNKSDNHLCHNGMCVNKKYNMTLPKRKNGNPKTITRLEIKNFTMGDIIEYTCSCQFVAFTKRLQVVDYICKYYITIRECMHGSLLKTICFYTIACQA